MKRSSYRCGWGGTLRGIRELKGIIAHASAYLAVALQYRSSVWIAGIGSILGLHVNYSLWKTVNLSSDQIGSLGTEEALQRVLLGQALIPILSQGLEYIVGHDIRTGNVAIQMSRPFDYQFALLGHNLGRTLGLVLMRSLPLYVVALLFYGLQLPTLPSALASIASISLSFLISFYITFLFSVLSFYTLNSWGLLSARILCVSFLSGALVPTELFPAWLKTVVDLLPFRSLAEIPILIYRGKALVGPSLGYQIVWLVVLLLLSRIVFSLVRRHVLVQGG